MHVQSLLSAVNCKRWRESRTRKTKYTRSSLAKASFSPGMTSSLYFQNCTLRSSWSTPSTQRFGVRDKITDEFDGLGKSLMFAGDSVGDALRDELRKSLMFPEDSIGVAFTDELDGSGKSLLFAEDRVGDALRDEFRMSLLFAEASVRDAFIDEFDESGKSLLFAEDSVVRALEAFETFFPIRSAVVVWPCRHRGFLEDRRPVTRFFALANSDVKLKLCNSNLA